MHRHHIILSLTLLVLSPLSLRSQDATEPTEVHPEIVKGITARELGAHMRFLSSDLMRGRDTASQEIRIAAEYLATRLEAAGADPAGDRDRSGATYFQRLPLEVITPKADSVRMELVFDHKGSRRVVPFQFGSDYVFFPAGVAPGEIEAPVVFAGYGRVDAGQEIDDYKDLDVQNRFVLVLEGDPPSTPSQNQSGNSRRGLTSSTAKRTIAQEKGALGLLVIQPPKVESSRALAPENLRGFFGRPSLGLPRKLSTIPQLSLDGSVRDRMIPLSELEADSITPRELEGVSVRFGFSIQREVKEDRNVVGIFPGTDPERSKEVVIYSAHYDHVGVNDQGEIFNGSDDNASGTSALLEIAEAFGEGPRPARSVAFLWVSGEEKGLLGSKWFADNITLPEGYSIIGNINLDMVSRNDSNKVGLTPSPSHPDHSTLIPAAQKAAKEEALEIEFNIDQFYRRTDSYSFAEKGIPVMFFFSGIHEDYHKSTDVVSKADFEKAARIARAAYRIGWETAQAAEPPKKIKGDAQTASTEARPSAASLPTADTAR